MHDSDDRQQRQGGGQGYRPRFRRGGPTNRRPRGGGKMGGKDNQQVQNTVTESTA